MNAPKTGTDVGLWLSLLKEGLGFIQGTRFVARHFAPSPEVFAQFRALQRQRRRKFADIAAFLPRYRGAIDAFRNAPLLADQAWVVPTPILLNPPNDDLSDDSNQSITTFGGELTNRMSIGDQQTPAVTRRIKRLLPSTSGTRFASLSEAIAGIEKPDPQCFQSRPCYSLARVSFDRSGRISLSFRKAYYFDYIDCGELLALELIREFRSVGDTERLRILQSDPTSTVTRDLYEALDERLKLRSLLGNWFSVRRRPSIAGVNMLTVFVDVETGQATFPMMKRSHMTGSAAGTVHVIPAGEFQPTSDARPDWFKHCTLWQTILREFAEELLNHAEAESHAKQMEELAAIEPIASMLRMIRSGEWKTHFLGIGLDPLTLKPEILVTSVINFRAFCDAFKDYLIDGRLPRKDVEGDIHITGGGWGPSLTETNLRMYRDDPDALPAASGCIELFLRSAQTILGHPLPP